MFISDILYDCTPHKEISIVIQLIESIWKQSPLVTNLDFIINL